MAAIVEMRSLVTVKERGWKDEAVIGHLATEVYMHAETNWIV